MWRIRACPVGLVSVSLSAARERGAHSVTRCVTRHRGFVSGEVLEGRCTFVCLMCFSLCCEIVPS